MADKSSEYVSVLSYKPETCTVYGKVRDFGFDLGRADEKSKFTGDLRSLREALNNFLGLKSYIFCFNVFVCYQK